MTLSLHPQESFSSFNLLWILVKLGTWYWGQYKFEFSCPQTLFPLEPKDNTRRKFHLRSILSTTYDPPALLGGIPEYHRCGHNQTLFLFSFLLFTPQGPKFLKCVMYTLGKKHLYVSWSLDFINFPFLYPFPFHSRYLSLS